MIPAATQQALRTLEWIDRHEVLCVCGPSGTGKSHLIEALGHLAIDKGRTVAWHTPETLAQLLRRHRVDDSINKAISKLIRVDLVVVDDVGLLPISADAAEALFRVVDAAYEKRSIAMRCIIRPTRALCRGKREVAAQERSGGFPVGIFRGPRGTSGARPGVGSGRVWR